MITGKNYVGSNLKAEGSRTFQTFNPKLNIPTQHSYTEASEEEIDEAMALADSAFNEFRWMPAAPKAAFLRAIADEIEALGDELINVYCEESGLPEGRARGERGRTLGQLRMFAEVLEKGEYLEARIDTAIPDRAPIPKADLRKMMIGLGPVVVFGASNFPLAYSTAGGDTASALAAGCPVVVKAHPMHAGTSELVASAIIKAANNTNMPDGVFSNLNGSGIELGQQLAKHPSTKAIGFTGSIKGGRALYDLAASREEPIPVFAEMGSINPVVLMSDYLAANSESVAQQYAGSITLGAGQFCTKPGLILGIEGESLETFASNLATEIEKIDPICMLHPNIAGAYEIGKETARAQVGVSVLTERISDIANHNGQMIAKVDGNTFLSNPQLHHEVFGPYSLIVGCEDESQLIEIIAQLEGQLTGTIMATEEELGQSLIPSVMADRVGRVIFNGVPTGVEVCPSMLHGGPYPASTDSRFTAVGSDSIERWLRPVSFQSWPNQLLPEALKDENSLGISRLVNGVYSTEDISR